MADTDTVEVDFDAIDKLKADDASGKDTKKPVVEAKKDETPEIEVVDETTKAEPVVLTPDAGLEKLKKQLEDEKAARADADRRAQAAAESERQARTEKQSTELEFVANTITSVTQYIDTLESKYAEALTAQDFAGAAKIQREMSTKSAQLNQLEDAKARLEKAPKPTIRQPEDALEAFCRQLTPQSAAWVRSHPQYARDTKLTNKMIAAHNLVKDDVTVDSPEYFQAVERALGIQPARSATNGHADDPTADAATEVVPAPEPKRRPAPPAAPPSRSGNGNGSRPNTVRLTAAQVEAAEASGITPEEYARNLLALQREGRLQ